MSDLFTSMCRGSNKIQEAWKQNIGDIYLEDSGSYEIPQVKTTHPLTEILKDNPEDGMYYYWLPRQEDLQELYMKETDEKPCDMMNSFVYEYASIMLDNNEYCYFRGINANDYKDPKVWEALSYDIKQRIRNFNTEINERQDAILLMWLLFVHKELWNQSWNFKEERWEE